MRYALLMGATLQQQSAEAFDEPETLRDAPGYWAVAGFKRDGGAVLEITPEAWKRTKTRLKEQGYDPETLQADGRLVVFDAHKVHAQFAWGEGLRPDRFKDVARRTLERIRQAAPDGPIHVWTASASLLQHHGDPWMAQFAESMWREIARDYGLQLIGTRVNHGWDPASMDLDDTEGMCIYPARSDDEGEDPQDPGQGEVNRLGSPEVLTLDGPAEG